MIMALIFIAGLWAGAQNALAGGGSFITLPALILAGLPPLAANITSTVALFPGQVVVATRSWRHASGLENLPLAALFAISLVGGAAGALLLLHTPPHVFARAVPWLVLAATLVFAWGNFGREPRAQGRAPGRAGAATSQVAIAIYGGYFGGGVGSLMLAALTMAGLPTRTAGATKNLLNGVLNAAAVVAFVTSPLVAWRLAAVLALGAMAGGLAGAWALQRVNEKWLKAAVVMIGLGLSIGLFVRPV